MITNIKLKNWKSHLDTSLSFTKGTNALLGAMGSGKSSVMDAISFCLFGTFPKLQTRRLKLNDVIMNKPSPKDTAELTLELTIDGHTYTVTRVVERGKGTTYSEIREGDRLIDAPNSQRVTEAIGKILKTNYELFSKAIYSEQNDLDYFLRVPRGERMKRIDNLLGMDKFEKARATSTSVRNKLTDRKLGKQSVIDQADISGLQKSLNDLEYSLAGLKKTKEKLLVDLEEVTTKKTAGEKRLQEMEELSETLNKLEKDRKSIQSAIEENEKIITEIKNLLKDVKPENVKEKIEALNKEIEKLESNVSERRDSYQNLAEAILQKVLHI